MIPFEYSTEPVVSPASPIVGLTTERLEQAGLEPEPMLREAGLTSRMLDGTDPRPGSDSQIRFLNIAADALHDPSLGLHLAQGYELRRLGLFYYLLASSETVGEALTCFERFGPAEDPNLTGTWRSSDIAITVTIGYACPDRRQNRHFSEFWILSICRLVRQLACAMVKPTAVSFSHQRSDAMADIETYFDAPVDFGGTEDRIDFDVQLADIRLPSFDSFLHNFLIGYFERMLKASHWAPTILWTRVKKAMAPRLSHRSVTTANIAKDLGMSTRTLSRRLSQEGKTFSGILDDLRAELAVHYIKIRGFPISEIAWHLGYREASAVVVAFRRWTGMSPTEVRRRYEVEADPELGLSLPNPVNGRTD